MVSESKNRRTHLERIIDIFNFIEKQENVFPKSQFKEIGLNPRTAEVWLRIIEYVQNQPKIRLIESEHNLLVEKVEGKYQAMMRKMSSDESLPFDQRLQHITDYLRSMYIMEKTKPDRFQPNDFQKQHVDFSQPAQIDASISDFSDCLNILTLLDTNFTIFKTSMDAIAEMDSIEKRFFAFSKWQKDVLLDKNFQELAKKVLNKEYYSNRLPILLQHHPRLEAEIKHARKVLDTHFAYLKKNLANFFFTPNP